MTNAEKFKNIFGLYATELWAKSEKEFLKWLNTETQETYCENLMDRQVAINGLDANHIECRNLNDWQEGWHSAFYQMKCKNLDELPEPCNDCISRHAAIDACIRVREHRAYDEIEEIKSLPPAQPEPLTDKEQRIFLSAMGREEEVCKEVDDAWRDCREPYEDSLVHVCNEIKRKVKGALWT